MARILTGTQSTGRPHLGNLMGAMLPAINLAKTHTDHEALFFIADLHTLTSIKDPKKRKEFVYATAAAWLACGLDTSQVTFYRQSKIPAVCELVWYLSCFTPYPMLANAHAFKDKAANLADVNAGLFTYPVLMAADILLYDADIIPVGIDQLQHIEITRDIAASVNHRCGETFVLPKAQVKTEVPTIPGTDGRKMSKSYRNTIDIFLPEKELKASIMAIQTDSIPLEQPKDPEQCTVFTLYSLLAEQRETDTMRKQYLQGGYGYGHAKKALLALILEHFAPVRQKFQEYAQDFAAIDQVLEAGEEKAALLAAKTLARVRHQMGY